MKRFIATLVALALAVTPQVALADHIKGDADWYVEYNSSRKMVDNYTQTAWADNVSNLQPGDDITFTVEMRHTNDKAGDWYLTNEVLKSLEEGDAKGSAYGYKLSYEGPSNSRTLYESETVGGTGSAEGLGEATNAMDDYFFLGTLNKGETGKVTVNVSLDGETEGNAYFDTLARLQLRFAVEDRESANTRETNNNRQNNEQNTRNTNRTQNNTQRNPQTEERVIRETTQDTRRPSDTKRNYVEDAVENTSQNTYNNVEGTPQNVENIEYVYVDGGTPPTTVVNRIIPGSTSGLAKTGDETTLFPVYAAMVGAGLVVLAVAIRIVRNKDNNNEKGDVR